jgi:uncharacterized membrane protein
MKTLWIVAAGMAAYLFLAACLSFRVAPSPAPEDLAVEIYTCKKIDDSGELYKPLDITTEFALDDRDVICFVRMKNIRKAARLRWRWYAPDLSLFKETKDTIINAEEDFLEAISAFDRITIPGESKSDGQWVVAVFMDRELIARKSFSFKKGNH